LIAKLTAAVANLPERERMIVTLYYHEELTLREIGQVLNLSEGRICQIFKQLVARLRDALGIGPEPADGAAASRSAKTRKDKAAMNPVRV